MPIRDTPLVPRCDIRFISLSPHFAPAGPDVETASPIGETKLFLACPSVFRVRGKIKCKHSRRHWQICCNVALNRREFSPSLSFRLTHSFYLLFVLIKYHFFNTGFTLLSINHFPLSVCLAACLPLHHPPTHISLVPRNVICQVHIASFLICYHLQNAYTFLYYI